MRVSMVLCLSFPPFHSLRAACEVKTGVDSTLRNGRVTRVEVEEKREMATTRAHRPIAPVIVRRSLFARTLCRDIAILRKFDRFCRRRRMVPAIKSA